jgi:hypothetical protein
LLAVAGCTALKNPNDRAADAGGHDAGPRDLGARDDMNTPQLDLGGVLDLGSPDMGPGRCAPSPPAGDATWARYPLPGTLGHPRTYQVTGPPFLDTVIDCVTGLEWQRTLESTTYTRGDAIIYCNGLSLNGHDDWRLPSTIELMTLVDYSVASSGASIDRTAFPGAPAEFYWSSSSVAGAPSNGWTIEFNYGRAYSDAATVPARARCVR